MALIIFASAYDFSNKNKTISEQQSIVSKVPFDTKTLKIGQITLNIEVADTDVEKEKGLSGREGLAENEGMLFIFDKEGYYGFWMKDMKFAVDIAWLDKNKKIIYIESDVKPETYPKIFNSPELSLFVLEIPAGFLVKNNIKISDQVAF